VTYTLLNSVALRGVAAEGQLALAIVLRRWSERSFVWVNWFVGVAAEASRR
jgi:hypothetical protein